MGYVKKNLGDKYTHALNIRLSESQSIFLQEVSNMLDVSPSDYIRMMLNSQMVAMGSTIQGIKNGGFDNENTQGHIDN